MKTPDTEKFMGVKKTMVQCTVCHIALEEGTNAYLQGVCSQECNDGDPKERYCHHCGGSVPAGAQFMGCCTQECYSAQFMANAECRQCGAVMPVNQTEFHDCPVTKYGGCNRCGSTAHSTGSPYCMYFDIGPGKEIPVTAEELAQGGTRADRRKPRVDLIPPDVLMELAKHYEYGARKYTENNWRRGMNYSRMYSSMQRHALKWWEGEAMDDEGFPHLIAVIWNAVGLMYFELHPDAYEGFDDRWPMHEMDFPDAHADLPRDDSNRVIVDTIKGFDLKRDEIVIGRMVVKIPHGFTLRGAEEIIKENDLTWDSDNQVWVNVPQNDRFCGKAEKANAPIIYRTSVNLPGQKDRREEERRDPDGLLDRRKR